MDRRSQSRVFVDLPVQIWGMDSHSRPFIQAASLRTVSGRGATLQCVDAQLKPGDVVDVLYLGNKAQFRVVWCGKPGTEMAGEVGIENLSTERLWDVDPLRCAAAGLDPREFSAHGLRSGYLTEASRQGVALPEAMQQSQHRSVQQAASYYNDAERTKGRAARLAI